MIKSIILKKQDRGEADELVVFLTREHGWLTGVAKNAKKSRVRFGGHLEPLAVVDITVRSRKRDDLVWIDEAELVRGFLRIRSDVKRFARAAYLLELALLFLPQGQPDPTLFDFFVGLLERLDGEESHPVSLMIDEISLLALLGFGPSFDHCPACAGTFSQGDEAIFSPDLGGACHPGCVLDADRSLLLSPDTLAVVRRALQLDRDATKRLRIKPKVIEELRRALSAFVRHLRGEEIKSLVFLEKMGI